MDVFNETRLRVWAQQPAEFFDEAIIDVDGTLVATDGRVQAGHGHRLRRHLGLPPAGRLAGQHRRGARTWSTAPATGPRTRAPPTRSTRPSPLCRRAGFRTDLLRGDTDFTQTEHLDRWDADRRRPLHLRHRRHAQPQGAWPSDLPAAAYSRLERPPRYAVKTAPRQRPEQRQGRGSSASGSSRRSSCSRRRSPSSTTGRSACRKTYRMIVRPQDSWRSRRGSCGCSTRSATSSTSPTTATTPADGGRVLGQRPLRPGEPDRPAEGRRAGADGAGGQPGEQLGVHGDAGLAWNLKAWWALLLPEHAAARGEAPGGEADAAADGVQRRSCGA